GIGEPEEVRRATDEYRSEQDVIGNWVRESCLSGPDYRAKASKLYASFLAYCKQTGDKDVNQTKFGAELARRYERYCNNGTWYRGIDVRRDTGAEGTEGTEPDFPMNA